MAIILKENNSNSLWESVFNMLVNSQDNVVKSRLGDTIEFGQVILCLDNPRQRWITSRVPAISVAFALAEVVWILNRSNDAKIINFWNPVLKNFSGNDEKYYGAYGHRIGHEFGIDQLNVAYNALKNNPDTRQVVIEYYKPDIDLPTEDGRPKSSDIPCNIASIIKIRNMKLEWTQIMRSNDVIRGLPYNIIQFTYLHELLANWLKVELGKYTHFADSLHIYKSDLANFNALPHSSWNNLDVFNVTKEISDDLFALMYSRMKHIVHNFEHLSEKELEKLSTLESEYESLNNMMYIIGTYAARKMCCPKLEEKLVKMCTNEIYVYLWKRWATKT